MQGLVGDGALPRLDARRAIRAGAVTENNARKDAERVGQVGAGAASEDQKAARDLIDTSPMGRSGSMRRTRRDTACSSVAHDLSVIRCFRARTDRSSFSLEMPEPGCLEGFRKTKQMGARKSGRETPSTAGSPVSPFVSLRRGRYSSRISGSTSLDSCSSDSCQPR